jgi:ssDNA-binding Zn-finger/Zn-ribbon topoisomerase 1
MQKESKPVTIHTITCPQCGSKDVIKKESRMLKSGTLVTRYQCKNPQCKYKFTPASIKKTAASKIHQIGKTSVALDRTRVALPPGKRISKTGKIYYEYRRNRSDINPKKRL